MNSWTKFPLIYEINTRVWLRELAAHAGHGGQLFTLADIPDTEFKKWTTNSLDAIWLMGVWQTGGEGRRIAQTHTGLQQEYSRVLPDWKPEDVVASPYSIASYSVATELGGDAALKKFRTKLDAHGIKLILDFVPNHVSLDHHWVKERPDYFISIPPDVTPSLNPADFYSPNSTLALACGRDPYFPAWTDTLQLNYASAALRHAMTESLKKIATQCDGVRCDMAMLMLKDVFNWTWQRLLKLHGLEMRAEFWNEAIAAVKQEFPQFLFLAEAYWGKEWDLQQLGFDFTYDKQFYDRLHNCDIHGTKAQFHSDWAFHQKLLRFTENHDEPRAATNFGGNSKAAALVALTAPGMRLLHQGQLEGWTRKLPVQLIRRPDEATNHDIEAFYTELLRVIRNTAIIKGDFASLDLRGDYGAPDMVIGFERVLGHQSHTMTIANFADGNREVYFFTNAFERVASYEHIEVVSTERHRSPQFDLFPGGMSVRLRAGEGLLFIVK